MKLEVPPPGAIHRLEFLQIKRRLVQVILVPFFVPLLSLTIGNPNCEHVDISAKDSRGETPLDWANARNQEKAADLLRKHGG